VNAVPDSNAAPAIKLVVFDLGRVLVRICRDWQHACECGGLTWPALDPATAARLRDVAHRAEIGQIDAQTFYSDAAALLACPPDQIRAISDAFVFGPYPGAADLLAELASAGVKTACLSNTNEHHWSLLSEVGHRAWLPMDRLHHHFASHLMRARKPDDAIYADVERQVGLPPESILFFDDLPDNIEAARRRGWNAHWIDPAPDDPIPQIRAALRRHGVI
jgi:putative hydrolase of the HAD superfamily